MRKNFNSESKCAHVRQRALANAKVPTSKSQIYSAIEAD
jgi:hypothetical protein